jgi:hypothetical protein
MNELDEVRFIAGADLHKERARRIRLVRELKYLLEPAVSALREGRTKVVQDRIQRALDALGGAE